jgi:hypothetical protein
METMHAVIKTIAHVDQRYPTVGDWQIVKSMFGDEIHVHVSELKTPHGHFLVAIHELIEAYLCAAAGITQEEVDAFDIEAIKHLGDADEPGDQPDAPYYHQHQFASAIERLLAAELGVNWPAYEREIAEL